QTGAPSLRAAVVLIAAASAKQLSAPAEPQRRSRPITSVGETGAALMLRQGLRARSRLSSALMLGTRSRRLVGVTPLLPRRDAKVGPDVAVAACMRPSVFLLVDRAARLRVGRVRARKKPRIVPSTCNTKRMTGVLMMYEHTFGRRVKMAAVANKSKPVAKTSEIHAVGIPAARRAGIVDRTAKLSDELLKSLETSERAAIEAGGQFVITIEEAVPQEVTGTFEVAQKITESGLKMADRLVHTEYDLLRHVVDSNANWLRRHDGAKPIAA
ncbi:MAG: hypothetical protein ACXVII_38015, partial [Solirubrobacteraceae bacterium]